MFRSSLNYKISLSEAVLDFTKKDMPVLDDQYIDVNLEDPKISKDAANKNGTQEAEEFDDMMWDMTGPNTSSNR